MVIHHTWSPPFLWLLVYSDNYFVLINSIPVQNNVAWAWFSLINHVDLNHWLWHSSHEVSLFLPFLTCVLTIFSFSYMPFWWNVNIKLIFLNLSKSKSDLHFIYFLQLFWFKIVKVKLLCASRLGQVKVMPSMLWKIYYYKDINK